MTKQHDIPEGWKMDGEGRLVRIENISAQHIEEDALVTEFIAQAQALQQAMQQLKTALSKSADTFVARLIEEYGIKKLGKIKGNIDFFSFDRRYKISRRVHDTIRVNARIEAARQLFDQYIDTVTQDLQDDGVKVLINRAFKPARTNEFSVGKLVQLLNLDIKHPLFRQAVEALRDALETDTSSVYFNFYERNNQGSYELISLRFSDVATLSAEQAAQKEG